MYEQFLTETGLSAHQAAIYEILIKNGPLRAGKIAQKSPLKRGLVYKTLDELVELDLIEKQEASGKVAEFTPKHPLKLQELSEKREQQARDAQLALSGVLSSLISDFNLISDKPGVLFFEGDDGIRRVAEDSLTAKTEIYSYADVEAVETYAHRLNVDYIARRRRMHIKKKVLVTNSPYNKTYFKKLGPEETNVRFINFPFPKFQTVMQIYDTKISYITVSEKTKIGVIVDNASIAIMHRALFEYAWTTAQTTGPQPTTSAAPSSPRPTMLQTPSPSVQTPPRPSPAPSGPAGTRS